MNASIDEAITTLRPEAGRFPPPARDLVSVDGWVAPAHFLALFNSQVPHKEIKTSHQDEAFGWVPASRLPQDERVDCVPTVAFESWSESVNTDSMMTTSDVASN
eukprot:1532788-Rhodomonas_salina.1